LPKAGGEFFQRVGHDGRAGDQRYEIGVAVPAWHEVNVQMFNDAGAGDFAQVDADVEAVGPHDFRERVLAAAREQHQLGDFLIGEAVEVGYLPVRDSHKVSTGIGIGD